MKKIIFVILCVLLMTSIFTVACFAATPETAEASEESIFSRLWEYVDTYSAQIVSYAVDIFVIIVMAIIGKSGKKLSAKLIGSLSKCASADTQEDVVKALNTVIAELNAEREDNSELKKAVALLKTDLSNVHKETRAIFDAMLSVWGNSKNLPQGIKDILTLTYSNCLKSEKDIEGGVVNEEGKTD